MENQLNEEMVDTKALDKTIRNWNETSSRISQAKAELKKLSEEAKGMESYIVQVMEQLDQEQRKVDNIVVKVKSKIEGGRPSYKKSFDFLLAKVNKQLREAADEVLESTRGDKWLKKWLVKEDRVKLDEGVIKRVMDGIRTAIDALSNKLKGVSGDIDLLTKMEKETTESTAYQGLADALLETATE